MDFERLAASLLARAAVLVPEWLPQGKKHGSEWTVGNLSGDAGESLSINLTTGVWKDFATGDAGADLTALYAALHHLTQGQAAAELESRYAVSAVQPSPASVPYRPVKPNGTTGFEGLHATHGLPYALHAYRDTGGSILFYIARYHLPTGKTFTPWTYDGAKWRPKAWPAPRPLYGLELLSEHPASTVLIVEGELKCDLTRRLLNPARQALVVTWCGGAAAYRHTDWQPLAGRRVIIWPDADEAGRDAASAIASLLTDVRLIDTTDRPHGWDVADLIAEGATSASLQAFVREHVHGAKASTAVQERRSVKGPPDTVPVEASGTALPVFASQGQCWEHFGLAIGTGSRPWGNIDNLVRILDAHPQFRGRFTFDAFASRVLCDGKHWDGDMEASGVCLMLQRECFMHRISTAVVLEAIETYAKQRRVHPVCSHFESLPAHDGAERMKLLFPRYFGAADTEYSRAVGVSFLVSCIARIYDPGCILRTMPVLEGAQESGKSTALSILGGQWYLDSSRRLDSKEWEQDIQGYWIVEISELSSMLRTSVEAVKAALSRRDDVFRASYGRRAQPHKRQCVLVGTTNSVDWQLDETGGTRFLPIACSTIDLAALRTDRSQLLAEAVAFYRSAAPWHLIPREQARLAQESRRIEDPWLEIIESAIHGSSEVIVRDLFHALEVPPEKRSQRDSYRIGRILTTLGYAVVIKKIHGTTTRVYQKVTASA